VAYRIVQQKSFPGWGHMLENGATTLWETWAFSDNVYSHNHPMFGSVDEWFYKVVAGISAAPDAVGFNRIIIRPRLGGGLTWAKASYESARGRIASEWRIDGDRLHMSITIPCNTTAFVHIPAKPGSIEGPPGLEYGVGAHGEPLCTVGSGTHLFTGALR
jgi:alpha-L-rhamnosidase